VTDTLRLQAQLDAPIEDDAPITTLSIHCFPTNGF